MFSSKYRIVISFPGNCVPVFSFLHLPVETSSWQETDFAIALHVWLVRGKQLIRQIRINLLTDDASSTKKIVAT